MPEKPTNIEEYKDWLNKECGIEITNRTVALYDSVTSKIKQEYEKSSFWKELINSLQNTEQEYLLDTGYQLFISNFKPELNLKTFDSFFLKTFRKNILDNKNFPKPPEHGWILPENWFHRVNDIIRTLFVVKYLDGVQFMIGKLESICKNQSMECKSFLEAREEGYYAAHIYTTHQCEIPQETWDTITVDVPIEVQITTQLQEVIRILLHRYYEKKRERNIAEDIKWQWNYESDEFVANYLGHILHYVEGMIMEIREKQKGIV